jgi:hypothetical protein
MLMNSSGIMISPNPKFMWRLERVWEERNRTPVLLVSGSILLIVAVADWWTMPYVSLGFLYLFPIMLAAGFLPRWLLALLGIGCAVLSELFSSLDRRGCKLLRTHLPMVGVFHNRCHNHCP